MPDIEYFQTPEFLARISAGERSVLYEVYDHYSPLLYGIILKSYCGKDSELMLEEVFRISFLKFGEFDPGKQRLFSWLLSHYALLDKRRVTRNDPVISFQ